MINKLFSLMPVTVLVLLTIFSSPTNSYDKLHNDTNELVPISEEIPAIINLFDYSSDSDDCFAGGPGSSSCTYSGSNFCCEITCSSGYSCCSVNGCTCIQEQQLPPGN